MTSKGEQARERILATARGLVMTKGFAGTSIDDILLAGGLSKGAFFHHFRTKGDLARELVEWHAERDLARFRDLAAQAEAACDDPLDQMIHFLKGFETYVSDTENPSPGCVYAVYVCESNQFDPSVQEFVADTLRQWTAIYVRKFQEILERHEPALPVTARQLAEMIVSVIEGGMVLQRAYDNVRVTARQSEQFRNYLQLLFPDAKRRQPQRRASRAPSSARRP